MDSVLTVHLTPLKATIIAYLPWTINDDNYVDYHLYSQNLRQPPGQERREQCHGQDGEREFGDQQLRLKIDNLRSRISLSMSVFAPPLTASVSTDLAVGYRDNRLLGKGTVGVKGFYIQQYRNRRSGSLA